MAERKIFDALNKPTELEKRKMVDFLSKHLEKYGDDSDHIRRAIDYSVKENVSFGGFIIALKNEVDYLGVAVVNRTGMEGYIPENILVYIATHKDHRGKGLGSELMKEAINFTKGDIALHVEADNPAVHLYKKFGFTNPYLEMRLKKSNK